MKTSLVALLLVVGNLASGQVPAPPAAQPQASPAPAAQPQKKEIKDPAEYNAYMAALNTQEIRSRITADTKQFYLLDLHAPVLIQGKIRSPEISIGRKIPIPTPDFGGAKDVDCKALVGELTAAK